MLALNILPSAVFLLISTALAVPVPVESPLIPSKINVNHFSKSTNQTTSHSIDASAISPALAKTIQGSTVNINFIGERQKRHDALARRTVHESRKINNSTINVTVVGGNPKRALPINASPNSTGIPAPPGTESPSTLSAAGKSVGSHSVLIDASGAKGGIHNSTLNINLHSRDTAASTVGHHSILISTEGAQDAAIDSTTMNLNILPRSAPSVGHHSVLLSTTSDNGEATIDSTTMNINILPRAVVGDHSILIDTSSESASTPRNSAGHHSVLLETKNKNGTAAAIKDSLINVTVVGGNKNLTTERKPRAGLATRAINPKARAAAEARAAAAARMVKMGR